jgi:predicted amidohydrolase YtcJ
MKRLLTTMAGTAIFAYALQANAQSADWIVTGGSIYAMDSQATQYRAMAVSGDEIVALGTPEEIASLQGADTRVIDLQGHVVFPGFIDTHIHTMDTLPLLDGVMLSPGQTAEAVLAAIAEHARSHPEQNPVLGSGFLARAFGVDGPTAAELDTVVADRPALIIDEGGHTAWANSLALAAAGINRETPDPVPGAHFFQRDDAGRPTGWLVEGAAIDPVMEALGVVSIPALAELAPRFFHSMSAVGLTAAFDAGMIDTGEAGMQLAYDMAQAGTLPVRIVSSLYSNRPEDLKTAHARLATLSARYTSEFFNVTTMKLSLDGTVEAKTAVTLAPYTRPEGHRASPLLPDPQVFDAVDEAFSKGIDLHLHAIGDGAVRTALNAIEAAQAQYPDSQTRSTICHIEVVDPADITRFGALNVIGQTTPTWFEYDYVALEYLGEERFGHLYPLASILRSGARVTLGSDYPVSWIGEDALNPMFNIEMAVTRQSFGNPDYPIQAKVSERLSVDQALRAHTVDAAYQLRLEDQIGTLAVGKQADFVILERDPYLVPVHEIHQIRVMQTFSDGRRVFDRAEEPR